MRKIKFRARNAGVPKCWVYGYFVIEDGTNYIINKGGRFKVIAFTECQYTGLKDKNGVEIYEGDILNMGIVSWYEKFGYEYYGWVILNEDNNPSHVDAFNIPLEVIGNTYDNPELL